MSTTRLNREPVGNLCVLRADDGYHWLVSICEGDGRMRVLRRFEARDKAAEYAFDERDIRSQNGEGTLTVHFPDDCPCQANAMDW